MKLAITNNGPIGYPISSKDEGGWADEVGPGATYELDRAESDVVTIGDNPSFAEDLKEAAANLVALFERLASVWKSKQKSIGGETEKPVVSVSLTNTGEKGVRVILGDNTKDFELAPGATQTAEAVMYIELRELGG